VAAGKKIIATDMDVPKDISRQVSRASGGAFEVRKLGEVGPQRAGDVEVIVLLRNNLVSKKLFKDYPNVKILQAMSAGVDFMDFSSIPRSVTLCSNAGAYREPIAEHVFGMILFFSKHLLRNHDRLRKGTFENSADGTYLAGRTIGVIGAGGIGQSVARVAKGFNMKTIGINTSGNPAPNFDKVVKVDRLDDLLQQSDVVVISLPLDIHTRNMIDAKKLRLMKEDAILVNVARGPIISQADLYAHMRAHPNFKAGIDVWWSYPKKGERFSLDFPFFELPNFLASPHNADGVPEATAEGQRHAFRNVLHFVRGEPLERVVDKANYTGLRSNHPA
jgi:phosphoglycerate dehydrogenase-like enzyme